MIYSTKMVEAIPAEILQTFSPFRLDKNRIHVWLIRNSKVDRLTADLLWTVLSEEEKECARRHDLASDRKRYVIAHGLLRTLLGKLTGSYADEVEIGLSDQLKPYFQHPLQTLYFSLGYSGDYIGMGLSFDREIGLDLEVSWPNFQYGQIAPYFFTPDERKNIQSASNFFSFWTRKEALLKASGRGIVGHVGQIDTCDETISPFHHQLDHKTYHIQSFQEANTLNWSISIEAQGNETCPKISVEKI